MEKSITSRTFGVALVASASLLPAVSGCTNTRYPDLMRVTAEVEETIGQQDEIYGGDGPVSARIDARERIIRLREKQMIMAQRIDVKTMPEVLGKSMTVEQAKARKSELVKSATERYDAARALPIPTAVGAKADRPDHEK